MAKLGSFYSLCPLIENKTLLEVTKDPEEGVVIVTLGRNLAGRYKVSDQKQITCWRTKDKLSSPVLFNTNKSKYVAVFNQSHLKFWNIDDDNLDKLKKYKLNKPIYTLIKTSTNIFIIFQNGAIYNLDNVLEDRKTLNPLGLDLKQIDHVLHEEVNDQLYIGLVSDNTLFWTKFEEKNYKYSKILLERNKFSIKGYVFHVIRNVIYLLTLWSDGSIFSRQLEDPNLNETDIGDLFTVVDSVSSKHFVCMKTLDENYIAIYGANNNEEGAMLALYNVQFKVTQSKQPFKLFTTSSKIWCLESNLFLAVGQNLAVVPFYLETEQLAALVGSHKDIQTGLDPDIKIIQELHIASWDGNKIQNKYLPSDLRVKIEQFAKQGLSECTILEELLPEILEKQDNDLLILLLNHFSDIPEKYLVKVLNHALNSKNNFKLLANILCRSFSEVLILPHLRLELPIDKVSELLKHLHIFWSKDQILPGLNNVETYTKLLEWSCAVIDSNYQKIVLSRDTLLVEMLNKLYELVQNYLICIENLKEVVPLLSNVKRNKNVDRFLNVNNLRYSIEQISLY